MRCRFLNHFRTYYKTKHTVKNIPVFFCFAYSQFDLLMLITRDTNMKAFTSVRLRLAGKDHGKTKWKMSELFFLLFAPGPSFIPQANCAPATALFSH